jgi:hypothetical protein
MATDLAVESKQLEYLEDPQLRIVLKSFETLLGRRRHKAVDVHDQHDEHVIRSDGEEDRVVEEVRIARVDDVDRDKVLLQTLNRGVDLVEQGPQAAYEVYNGGGGGATS